MVEIRREKEMRTKHFLLVLTIIGMGILLGCAKQPTLEEQAQAYYGQYPENYQEIIRENMFTYLIDPESAQYRFQGSPTQGFYSLPFGKGVEYGWFGEVYINAKNRMGGYVGAKLFDYLIRDGKLIVFEEKMIF